MNRAELEAGLKRISGITGVRVVGEDQPTEIHVVASQDRSPKQVVRDVQSLAAAGFGLAIDHRIVSVVQVDEPSSNGHRPSRILIDRIEVSKGADSEWVKVMLRHPSGDISEGSCTGGGSRTSRGKAAVIATLRALDPVLSERRATVDLESLSLQSVDSEDAVCVRAAFAEGGIRLALVGTAVIEDDIATAAIKALLQALNRKLL
ncbi:MAG: hypothetical protein M3N53_04445 [Actinomycetota bacterium]|nr:hypothetical protein [Actinomycetota bacterium]